MVVGVSSISDKFEGYYVKDVDRIGYITGMLILYFSDETYRIIDLNDDYNISILS